MSNPPSKPEIQYAYLDSSADWSTYLEYRPSYPSATEKLIIAYHRAHSNSLRLAHDVGSGSAVFVPRLAEYFQHVHVSDPSPRTLSLARERLTHFYKDHWWKCTFSFSVATAEESADCVATGSVDLISMMMCSHWPDDTEAMMDAAAQALAPNGTLVVVNYAPCCRVVENAAVDAALWKLWTKWGQNFAREASRRVMRNNSPLDFIGLREDQGDEIWIQDVTKRVKVNFRERGNEAFVIPGSGGQVAESRVGEKQRKYAFNDEDEDGTGWRKEVDARWLRGYLASMEKKENLHLYEDELDEVENVIRKTTKSGQVLVEWAASILLATKK